MTEDEILRRRYLLSDRYAEVHLEDMRHIVRNDSKRVRRKELFFFSQRLHHRPCQLDRQEVDPVVKENVWENLINVENPLQRKQLYVTND